MKLIFEAPKMLWLLTGDDGSQAQAGVSCVECEASRGLKIDSEMVACDMEHVVLFALPKTHFPCPSPVLVALLAEALLFSGPQLTRGCCW